MGETTGAEYARQEGIDVRRLLHEPLCRLRDPIQPGRPCNCIVSKVVEALSRDMELTGHLAATAGLLGFQSEEADDLTYAREIHGRLTGLDDGCFPMHSFAMNPNCSLIARLLRLEDDCYPEHSPATNAACAHAPDEPRFVTCSGCRGHGCGDCNNIGEWRA